MFIWTISGLTLAACSDIEDFLGLDDGGASGPVRFMPADEAARMAQEMALAPDENDATWSLQVEATSTRMLEDGTSSPIVSYEFVYTDQNGQEQESTTHPDGFTISPTADGATITLASGTFDFETRREITLIVQATDTPINADDEAQTGRQRYTINVQNLDEGDSVYEIVGDVIDGQTLEVMRISEDPDGEGAISVVWYRGTASTPTGTRGTTYLVTADDVGETIGAVISYIDGANEPESIDITASSVAFASGMGSRPIGVDEGTIATTTTLATVSATSELGEAVTYAIGTASDHDNALFTVNSSGEISLNAAGTWDYESDTREYVVEVIASASDGEGGMDTARARITFNVQNVDETGMRAYEIDAPATLEVGSVLTAQRVAGSDEDPDGVDENSITYQWLADGTEIFGATGATYTLTSTDDPNAVYTVRVMYYDGYNAALPAGSRTPTRIEASTSPIKLAGTPYTGTINEDGTSADLPQVMASVDGASGHSFTYQFLHSDSTTLSHLDESGIFSLNSGGGVVLVDLPDHETTPRHELTVRVTYDSNGNTAGGEIETRDVQVVIDVNNVHETGTATYEITQSTPALAENTILTAEIAANGDDPDGVYENSITYQWLADGVIIPNENEKTYTIGSDVATTYSVRITYLDGYNAGLAPADQMRTEVIASTSPIKLMQDGSQVLSYTASVDEDASAGALIVTLDASVDGAPVGHSIRYDVVRGSNFLANTDPGNFFELTSSGKIGVLGVSTLDYETATSHEFTVRVTYDADGNAGTTGDIETRDVQVVIDVGNALIELADADGDPVTSYTGSVNEDGTSPDLPRIRASVDNVAQGSIIEYAFLESGGGRNAISEGGVFQINSSTGAISVADSSLLDYETTPRYELTVSVLYDADGDPRTTTDEVTKDVQVVIAVNDVAGQSPAIIPDRQSFAHQDPYEPDELGLTPMPDADPSAG